MNGAIRIGINKKRKEFEQKMNKGDLARGKWKKIFECLYFFFH
jgi:hypothetical protein